MEPVIDANAPLDCIDFRIAPSQNRYEAFACCANNKEKVAAGLLEHLLLHSAKINALYSKGSDADYKLKPPENPHDIKWFTKSTLERFLQIVGSPNILDITNPVKKEISQLEESRTFHLSLYAKGTEYQLQSGESDSSWSSGASLSPKAEGSDASKNELLRAMDLRLTALRGELTAAFDQAVNSRYSIEDMTDLEKFSHQFGSIYLRDSLRKHIELIRSQAVNISSSIEFLESDKIRAREGINDTARSLSSGTPVKYGASPAKVAQVERQSLSDSGESSFSSDEEQPSVGRSRTLIRSASPRRSASPMRRVQIGRSGSRRSTAISIKSLNYIPTRERTFLPKDPASYESDDEGPEQAPKKSENNVRMSVQDAINLFERKQRDQTGDVQNARSVLSSSTGANKSVLRRWSSGIGEDSSQHPEGIVSEDVPQIQNNLEGREIANSSAESKSPPGIASECYPIEHCELDVKLNSTEKTACSPVVMEEKALPTESTDFSEKLSASAEWSRKTEAELNELMMKMVESKNMKCRTVVSDSSKKQSLPAEQRGGFYDHYKEKRDEKLRGETARKKVEKDKQFRAMQQILDARKSELILANTSDDGKKQTVKKLQKSQKAVSQPVNPKTESPKLSNVKKATVKASSLPATRKSWPSTPPMRAPGASPAKTSTGTNSIGTTPTRRRSQPIPPVSRSSPKVEAPQPLPKSVKSNDTNNKKIVRNATEKKQQPVTKPSKTTKTKVQTPREDPVSVAKPSLYSKVTKKGSVVPLESKPSLRKGSGTISKVNPIAKIKESSHPQEPLMNSEDQILAEENKTVSNSSDPVVEHQESELRELNIHMGMESWTCAKGPPPLEDKESFVQVYPSNKDDIDRVVERELEADVEEESTISPTAWVEIEEHEDRSLSSSDHICKMGSPSYVAPVKLSNSRVRHSLSQMLLEESTESDIIDWGNAENPPPMAYQRDVPKGLMRLLNFARKSKTDATTTGWSSPTLFSEGEDDAEDSKAVNKRSAENLLKKATLHSKNNGNPKAIYETSQKNSTDFKQPAIANITKSNMQSLSQQLQENYAYASASVTTTKATRSFFSLSAFKGSK